MQVGPVVTEGLDTSSFAEPRSLRNGVLFCLFVVGTTLMPALFLSKSLLLAGISDLGSLGLAVAAAGLVVRNARKSRARVRGFWLLIALGYAMWLGSLTFWAVYELWFQRPVPDIPLADMLLLLKLVPMTVAVVIQPQRRHNSRFRAYGLLDVSILIVYSLYLYLLCVFAYRLVPGVVDQYNFRFNVADAIGNGIFAVVAGVAFFAAKGGWKRLYGFYFLGAAAYCLASNLNNVAIDSGRYYSGSLSDVPLLLSHAAMVVFAWQGLAVGTLEETTLTGEGEKRYRSTLLSSVLAMIVTLSTPIIGVWLLTHDGQQSELFGFRLKITLGTIFLLTLLLALKQHFLTDKLTHSLQSLSETYRRIHRFKDQLSQSERLASLGALVAEVANEITAAMVVVRSRSAEVALRADGQNRIQSMAGKIEQYAQRTDALVESMLRFAQETPLQLSGVNVKPLIDSALHLSRMAKLPNIAVNLWETGEIPKVLGDSSQLLHVFLQILSNAIDALDEVNGGTLDITISSSGSQVRIEFADSGVGIQEPEHVFEPFYTTKAVGKGTGLGLSTCYGIIQKHRGEIACRNRLEGGAVFSIVLPAVLAPEVEGSPSESAVMEGR